MPHLGLIRENERKISIQNIVDDQYTYLASKHFRNEILYYYDQFFDTFKNTAEKIWPGLIVRGIESPKSSDDNICFLIRDNTFSSEIGLMGSGLQMYLQIIWFISRHSHNSTIILDEPDVYLHPSLQKKIFNYILERYSQVIVATHSIELLSVADYKDVFQINKDKKLQDYSKGISSVQNIIKNIGGDQNISLLRLGRYNKCIFVEGFDKKIINIFYNILYPDSANLIGDLPIIELNGFTNYPQAVGASKLFFKESADCFKCICILDRDYRLEKDLVKIRKQAELSHLILHVWEKKELESYLINLKVIYRFIEHKTIYSDFCNKLDSELNVFYYELMDQYSNSIYNSDRSQPIQLTNELARNYIDGYWNTLEGKIKIINGKKLLKFIFSFIKNNYRIDISQNKLISSFTPNDIDPEMKQVIELLIK